MMSSGNYIDGQWREGKGSLFFSLNPATLETIWEGRAAQEEEIHRAIQSAHQAFPQWSQKSPEERLVYLENFAELLKQRKAEFAVVISEDTGKPLWESQTEVQAMINKVKISAKAYQERCTQLKTPLESMTRWTRYKPHGVVTVLGPFNLPGHLPNGHIIPALLAGNTVIFKPSELTPLVAEHYLKIWDEIGIPSGVINLVQGGKETGKILIEHVGLDGIFFTGSSQTGQYIHQTYADHPEKILALEMGGNNPLIVIGVQDVKAASYMSIQSIYITAGQRCTCARRLIVPQGKEGDHFIDCFVAMTQKIRLGVYTDRPEPFLGPVISEQAAVRLQQDQKTLKRQGGEIFLKMEPMRGHKTLLNPGVMDVTNILNRPDQEIFGPFIQIVRVKDYDHALNEAKQTAYGLAAGLLCDDAELYRKFFQTIKAGMINWNRPLTGASSEGPFGGTGKSGNHRPSAYLAADYCSYPVASLETERLMLPQELSPGISIV